MPFLWVCSVTAQLMISLVLTINVILFFANRYSCPKPRKSWLLFVYSYYGYFEPTCVRDAQVAHHDQQLHRLA